MIDIIFKILCKVNIVLPYRPRNPHPFFKNKLNFKLKCLNISSKKVHSWRYWPPKFTIFQIEIIEYSFKQNPFVALLAS